MDLRLCYRGGDFFIAQNSKVVWKYIWKNILEEENDEIYEANNVSLHDICSSYG